VEIVQGQESVPSILEADARGDIADIFADVRKVLGTSVVNLIWHNLATLGIHPGYDCYGINYPSTSSRSGRRRP
jgi:hypothetical protein